MAYAVEVKFVLVFCSREAARMHCLWPVAGPWRGAAAHLKTTSDVCVCRALLMISPNRWGISTARHFCLGPELTPNACLAILR